MKMCYINTCLTVNLRAVIGDHNIDVSLILDGRSDIDSHFFEYQYNLACYRDIN